MAFGNITTFYLPIAGSAGSSQWGTDVRKLLNAADATSDTTTITSHGTGAATQRTFDPYTTSSTDATEADYGWAITPADMGSVSGALRYFPAGDHVATCRFAHNSTNATNGTWYIYAYRVAATTRARTLLGSATATVALPAVSGQTTGTVTLTLDEVVLQADETIQYSFEFNITGQAITGRTVNMCTGTTSGVQAKIVTPGLRTLADTTGTAAGVGSASGVTGNVLGTSGASAGVGSTSGIMSSRSDTTGTSTGTATVSGLMSSVAGIVGAAAGSAATMGLITGIGSMAGASAGAGAASGAMGATAGMVGTAAGVGSVAGAMSARADMTGSSTGVATATALASSVAGSAGSAAGSSSVAGLASTLLGTVGTVSIGAPTSTDPDYPVTTPTKRIAGSVIHHETGAAIVGATVTLYRDSDDLRCVSTTSTSGGAYSFLRDASDPHTYFVIAEYTDAGTPVQGVTDRGLVPQLI